MASINRNLLEQETDRAAFQVPPLPEGKLYHAMFSFHSEDRGWTRKFLQILEAEPYNLTCCIADRDFHPGKEVIHNIETCMSQSLNIILVISPEHTESHYCDFETSMSVELMHKKKAKVIPVLRKGQNVPQSLRFINYIDARTGVNDIEVIEKLTKSITEGLDISSPSCTHLDYRYKNGEEFRMSATKKLFISVVPEMTESQSGNCAALGMQMTLEQAHLIQSVVNAESFITNNWIFFTHGGRASVWILLTLFFFTLSVCGLIWQTEVLLGIVMMEAGFCSLFGSIVFPLLIVIARRCLKKARVKTSGLISQSMYEKKVMVCIGDERNNPVLRFIQYDTLDCQDYLRGNMCLNQLPESEQNQVVEKVIDEGLLRYMEVFLDPSMEAPRIRHRVRGDLMCLCQYIEMKEINVRVLRQWQQPSDVSCCSRMCYAERRSPEATENTSLNQNHVESEIV